MDNEEGEEGRENEVGKKEGKWGGKEIREMRWDRKIEGKWGNCTFFNTFLSFLNTKKKTKTNFFWQYMKNNVDGNNNKKI